MFRNPPAEYRILPGFGGHLGEISIRHIKSLGFGGVLYMWPKEGYLTDRKGWEHLEDVLRELKEQDLYLWVYDEEGFPSGAAGGRVLEGYPEGEALGLYYDFVLVEPHAELRLKPPLGDPVYVKAAPVRGGVLEIGDAVDLAESVEDGHIIWKAPGRQRWLLMAFMRRILYEKTFAEFSDIKTPYHLPNLMDRRAIGRFLRFTHELYYRRFGKDFGRTVPAFFTDEPCLLNYRGPDPAFEEETDGPTQSGRAKRVTAVPWHQDFPRWFLDRNGYDIVGHLPALYHHCGPETKKIRCDYWELVSEKVETAYHKQIAEWCDKHGVAYSGHLLMEERLPWHVMMQGDYMRCLRHMHIPGIDVLVSKSEQTRPGDNYYRVALFLGAKYCSSVKHHYRRTRALSETSGYAQWMEKQPYDADDVRATFSWQCAFGIDTFVTFYGGAGFSYGDDYFPPEKWKDLNDYVGRLCLCLTGGSHVCDVAVFYPIKSQWANHVKMENQLARDAGTLQEYLDAEHGEVSMELLENQRDFDYLHQQELLDAGIREGCLCVADEAYRVLVFPPMDTEDAAVIDKAIEFAEAGGIVLAVGRLPRCEARGADRQMQRKVALMLRVDTSRVRFIRDRGGLISALDALSPRDLKVEPASRKILCVHRRKNGSHIFFVFNNSSELWSGSLTLAVKGKVEIWDPWDGSIHPAEAGHAGNAAVVDVTLRRYCGILIVIGG